MLHELHTIGQNISNIMKLFKGILGKTMRFCIDRFFKMGGTFIVQGWAEAYKPGSQLHFLVDGNEVPTLCVSSPNASLAAIFGQGAEYWGFRAVTMFENAIDHSAVAIGFKFPDGTIAESLAAANPREQDHFAHGLWSQFVGDANAKGGHLVEIGSRARSGAEVRSLFGPSLTYIGVDIADGPNVDIVADAHHLSNALPEPVDFICSISTFEHLMMPWKAVLEINKSLKLGGLVFSHSHQAWPLHDVPFDYFRFSDQAWHGLFNQHTGFRVIETRLGHPVSISAHYNPGPPFDELENSPAYAMSVCLAEKIGDPLVSWDAPMSGVREIDYTY